MLIENQRGDQLLELIAADEAQLSGFVPLTHALIVARHAGRSLLLFNRAKRHWELAGGMIDTGETPRQCARRELLEESGIDCAHEALHFRGVMKFLLQPSRFHADVHVEFGALYSLDIERTEAFTPNAEMSELCWWDGESTLAPIAAIDAGLCRLCAAP